MPQTPLSKFADNWPVTLAIGFSQAVLGMGIGLLAAGRLDSRTREKLGMGLFIAGLAALAPAAVGIAEKIGNRPHSSRRMRHKLESIRQDTGLSELADAS